MLAHSFEPRPIPEQVSKHRCQRPSRLIGRGETRDMVNEGVMRSAERGPDYRRPRDLRLQQDQAEALTGRAATTSCPCCKDKQVCISELAGEAGIVEPWPQAAPTIPAHKLPKVGRRLASATNGEPDTICTKRRDRFQQLRQALLPPVVQAECGNYAHVWPRLARPG